MKQKKTKKNSNYQTNFTAVAKRFPEYDFLKGQLHYKILLDIDAQSKEVGRFITLVFQKLRDHTVTQLLGKSMPTPDYMGFRMALGPYLTQERHTSAMHYKGITNGAMQDAPTNDYALYAITALYHSAFEALGQQIDQAPDEAAREALGRKYWPMHNRLKLLYGMFENKERLFAGFKSTNFKLSLNEENLLEFGDEIPIAQELMVRLSFALNHNLKDAAHRLVGMMHMVRNKLDAGEYPYFSAMVYMKEPDRPSLEKARKELERIPETAPEFGTSRGMLAEVLARSGDAEAFSQIFAYSAEIGQFAMNCYLQQLILNMRFESTTWSRLGDPEPYCPQMEQLLKIVQKFNIYFPNTVEITGNEQEFHFYLSNILDAAGQYYRYQCEEPYMSNGDQDDKIVPGTAIRAYTLLALTAPQHEEALTNMMEADTRQARMDFVIKYFNFPRQGSVISLRPRLELMLRAYRTFLQEEEFVDVFLNNYKTCEEILDPKVLQQWLTEACFAALACEHPQLAKLRSYLDKYCPDFENRFADDVTYHSVLGMITESGKLLYASAESSYRDARDSDYGWKDAGMLSLGFFRLVEVEMRQKLLVDVLGKNDPEIRQWLREVAECNKLDPQNPQIFTLGNEKADLFRTLVSMKKPEKLTMEGMEFCFCLLSDKAVVQPQWQAYQDSLRRKLYAVLTPEGVQAARDNRFSQAISTELRETFRNPPAHARYLPIEKAGECRDYVNNLIKTLYGTWLA